MKIRHLQILHTRVQVGNYCRGHVYVYDKFITHVFEPHITQVYCRTCIRTTRYTCICIGQVYYSPD